MDKEKYVIKQYTNGDIFYMNPSVNMNQIVEKLKGVPHPQRMGLSNGTEIASFKHNGRIATLRYKEDNPYLSVDIAFEDDGVTVGEAIVDVDGKTQEEIEEMLKGYTETIDILDSQ